MYKNKEGWKISKETLNDDEDRDIESHEKNGRNKRKDRGSPPRRPQEFKRRKKPNMD